MSYSRFAAVVVVYNCHCSESLTIKAFLENPVEGLTVLVYDNSTKDYHNKTFCAEKGYVYLGGEGNHGISKAYNRAVEEIRSRNLADVVCFFDDDTALSGNYFEQLTRALEKNDASIFLPLIFSGETLISPIRINAQHKVRFFSCDRTALDYRGSDLSAINSCMAVKMQVFDRITYDENIFLDGVDHHFMDVAVRDHGFSFCVFPYRCKHSFSGMEKPSFESALNRFRIYAKDYGYIFKKKKFAYWKLVGKRALKLCFQYKSLLFLRYL